MKMSHTLCKLDRLRKNTNVNTGVDESQSTIRSYCYKPSDVQVLTFDSSVFLRHKMDFPIIKTQFQILLIEAWLLNFSFAKSTNIKVASV